MSHRRLTPPHAASPRFAGLDDLRSRRRARQQGLTRVARTRGGDLEERLDVVLLDGCPGRADLRQPVPHVSLVRGGSRFLASYQGRQERRAPAPRGGTHHRKLGLADAELGGLLDHLVHLLERREQVLMVGGALDMLEHEVAVEVEEVGVDLLHQIHVAEQPRVLPLDHLQMVQREFRGKRHLSANGAQE